MSETDKTIDAAIDAKIDEKIAEGKIDTPDDDAPTRPFRDGEPRSEGAVGVVDVEPASDEDLSPEQRHTKVMRAREVIRNQAAAPVQTQIDQQLRESGLA